MSNFPGIDGVIGDIEGRLFTLQSSIAAKHNLPNDGITKTWCGVPLAVRTARSWHHVVVSDTQATARLLMSLAQKQLKTFTLGPQQKVHMKVWGCVL